MTDDVPWDDFRNQTEVPWLDFETATDTELEACAAVLKTALVNDLDHLSKFGVKPMTEPNRYGAQGIYNETGVHCCCHMVPLTDVCDGCVALESTKRRPTLVGVDPVRMNPLNDDGGDEPDPKWVATVDERVRGTHQPSPEIEDEDTDRTEAEDHDY